MTSNKALQEQARALIAAKKQRTLTPAQERARECRLAQFVRWAWPLLEPATPLVWNWHMDAMCSHVEALLIGTLSKQNLLILVPPGYAKSTVVSVCAPVWRWVNQPAWRALMASGNERVSVRDSLKRRAIVESAEYRRAFAADWSLSGDANLKTRYANTATGFHQALTTGQRVTGDRADALFIDDPGDAATIHSAAERANVERWYFEAFANRLANMQTGTRCLIAQRLHSLDLAGLVQTREPDAWEVLTIPQEFDAARRTVTSLGWTDPRSDDGELAFPARYPRDVVEAERLRLGRSGYASQHQQQPFDASGEIFRTDNVQLWPAGVPLPAFTRRVLSLDTAFSIKSSADYSVILELGQFDRGVMIISCLRQRLEYPQLKQAAAQLSAAGGISAVLIEDKASGQSLVQDLRQSTNLPVLPIRVDSDKVSRAHTCVPTVEAGRVFVPADATWLNDFLTELAAFPKGAHDDIVDAFTQGINYLIGASANPPLLGFMAAMHEQDGRQRDNSHRTIGARITSLTGGHNP